jgi:hypothetical protein
LETSEFASFYLPKFYASDSGGYPNLIEGWAGCPSLDPNGMDLTVRSTQNFADHAATR